MQWYINIVKLNLQPVRAQTKITGLRSFSAARDSSVKHYIPEKVTNLNDRYKIVQVLTH